MAQQGKKKKKKRSWWIDLPLAAGIVACCAVYTRHYPPVQQGRAFVIIGVATVMVIIGFKLIDTALKRSRRRSQPQQRRGYGYRGASER